MNDQVVVVPVVGVTFENEDGESRQSILDHLYMAFWTEGEVGRARLRVEVQPDPENPVDPNAIVVLAGPEHAPLRRIGYLPGKMCPALLASQRAGRCSFKGAQIHEMGLTSKDATIYVKLGLPYSGPTRPSESTP